MPPSLAAPPPDWNEDMCGLAPCVSLAIDFDCCIAANHNIGSLGEIRDGAGKQCNQREQLIEAVQALLKPLSFWPGRELQFELRNLCIDFLSIGCSKCGWALRYLPSLLPLWLPSSS